MQDIATQRRRIYLHHWAYDPDPPQFDHRIAVALAIRFGFELLMGKVVLEIIL